MIESIKYWTSIVIAGAVAWPVGTWVLGRLSSFDGRQGVPIVVADSVIGALTGWFVGSLLFGIISLAVGRITNRYFGLLAFGLCWLIVARRSIPTDELLRLLDTMDKSSSTTFLLMALESLLWSAVAMVMIVVHRQTSPNIYPRQDNARSTASLKALGFCVALTIGLAWVFLRTDTKGQTTFGFVAACAIAAMVVRLMWPRCNATVLFIAPVVAGIVAPISALIMNGSEALARQAAEHYWALGRMMPMDVAGSGVFGIALGIALARTFGPEVHPAMDPEPGPNSDSAPASATANGRIRSRPVSARNRPISWMVRPPETSIA